MAHPNEELARQAYKAIATGDIPWLEAHMDEAVVFHQGGRFPTAGRFNGRDAVFGHMMEFFALVDKFDIEVHDVLANDDHIVGLVRVTIAKGDRSLTFDEAHVWHVRDRRVTAMWAVPVNPYEIDDFLAPAGS